MKTAYLKVLSYPASTAICQTKRNMMAIPNPVNATPTFPKKDASDKSTISTPDAMVLQQRSDLLTGDMEKDSNPGLVRDERTLKM
jgi:hypothetical protein